MGAGNQNRLENLEILSRTMTKPAAFRTGHLVRKERCHTEMEEVGGPQWRASGPGRAVARAQARGWHRVGVEHVLKGHVTCPSQWPGKEGRAVRRKKGHLEMHYNGGRVRRGLICALTLLSS